MEISHLKVFYSVFGSEDQKEKSVNVINQNVSKIRYEVGKRIRLRLTPELRFIQDNSIERGSRVNEILEKISRGEV